MNPVLDEYNSIFITYEILPRIYTFKDLSEVHWKNLQLEIDGDDNAIHIEFDDITMRTKLVIRSGIIVIRFDEKLFLVLS